MVSSDHAPYRFDETGKLAHGPEAPFKSIANGMPGIAARLPLLFSEGVAKGRITLNQFVALSATNAARIYGMPRKGTIAIGADADIAIWDPEARWTLTAENQHDAMDYSPFEGWEVTGRPMTVLSRGRKVVEEGAVVGLRGGGAFVARGVPDLTGLGTPPPPERDPARNFGAELGP
jgi:dihydropyrimidinase